MIKATVLYGQPTDADAFKKYYSETHLPLAAKTQGVLKAEFSKCLPNPDGSTAAFFRIADLYFAGPAEMQAALGSPERKAMAADLQNFAIGGVTILFSAFDN